MQISQKQLFVASERFACAGNNTRSVNPVDGWRVYIRAFQATKREEQLLRMLLQLDRRALDDIGLSADSLARGEIRRFEA